MTLHLTVVSPQKKVMDGNFSSVTVPTQSGEITILPNHAPLFSNLKPGEVIAKGDGEPMHLAVTGGFVSVFKNEAKLLVDFAVLSHEIEEQKILEAKKRAEEQIAVGADNDPATIDARAELVRAMVQLQVAQKRNRHHN